MVVNSNIRTHQAEPALGLLHVLMHLTEILPHDAMAHLPEEHILVSRLIYSLHGLEVEDVLRYLWMPLLAVPRI